jgi:hypothetical protein
MTTPIKTDNEKEQAVIKKFIEHRDFNVSWANNNTEEWMNHREKYGKEVLIPTAVSSKIVTEPDNEGNVSFTEMFLYYMAEASKNIQINNPNLEKEKTLLFVEYNTTIEVSKYIGLTSEQFYNLPSTDPNKLRLIFDLGELVHRLINADIYEDLASEQDEQMKERSEWRESVFRK